MAILVFCEDDPTIRKLIITALRNSLHNVHLAIDGVTGMALITKLIPDAIFADIAMPNIDGLQLIEALQQIPMLAAIPVVIMSASIPRMEIDVIRQYGAQYFLAKPFEMQTLRDMIDEVLRATPL